MSQVTATREKARIPMNKVVSPTIVVLYADDSGDKDLELLPILLRKKEKAGQIYEAINELTDRLNTKYGHAYVVVSGQVYKVAKKEWHQVRMRTVEISETTKWETEAVLGGRIDEETARRREKAAAKNE